MSIRFYKKIFAVFITSCLPCLWAAETSADPSSSSLEPLEVTDKTTHTSLDTIYRQINLLTQLSSRAPNSKTDEIDGTKLHIGSYINESVHFIEDLKNFHEIRASHEAPGTSLLASTYDEVKRLELKPFNSLNSQTNPGTSSGLQSSYKYLKESFVNKDKLDDVLNKDTSRLGGKFTAKQFTRSPRDLLQEHFKSYCDNYGTDSENICKAFLPEPQTASVNSGLPSADINAETLFHNEKGISDAKIAYIQNLTDPFPKNPFPFDGDNFAANTNGDRETVANLLIERAFRSLSQYVLNDISNRHIQQQPPPPGQSGNQVSVAEMVEKFATLRLKDNEWIASIEIAQTEGLLREIAQIEASRLFIDYLGYRQNEHIEALLSAMVIQNLKIATAVDFSNMEEDNPEVAEAGNLADSYLVN